jgi:hypothetical protein
MLTPILATDDPYEAAAAFINAGWSLVFQTPRDSGDPLACVALADSQLMLGTSLPEFLPVDSRAHRGAGVEFHVTVPSQHIGAVYEAHRCHAGSVTELAVQPWGEYAFHTVMLGYRFLIAAERDEQTQPPPDTALLSVQVPS